MAGERENTKYKLHGQQEKQDPPQAAGPLHTTPAALVVVLARTCKVSLQGPSAFGRLATLINAMKATPAGRFTTLINAMKATPAGRLTTLINAMKATPVDPNSKVQTLQ